MEFNGAGENNTTIFLRGQIFFGQGTQRQGERRKILMPPIYVLFYPHPTEVLIQPDWNWPKITQWASWLREIQTQVPWSYSCTLTNRLFRRRVALRETRCKHQRKRQAGRISPRGQEVSVKQDSNTLQLNIARRDPGACAEQLDIQREGFYELRPSLG